MVYPMPVESKPWPSRAMRLTQTVAVIATCGLIACATAQAAPEVLMPGGWFGTSFAMNAAGDYMIGGAPDDQNGSVVALTGNVNQAFPAPVAVGRLKTSALASAVSANGTRFLAWFMVSYNGFEGADVPQIAIFEPGATTPTIETLPPMTNFEIQNAPHLAVGPNGEALIVWAAFKNKRSSVVVSQRPAGGSFGPPTEIFLSATRTSIDRAAFEPSAAFDANGVPTVVWSWGSRECSTNFPLAGGPPGRCKLASANVHVVTGNGSGGFNPSQRVSGGRGCQPPQLTEADTGDALLFQHCSNEHGTEIRVSKRVRGGAFGVSKRITPLSMHVIRFPNAILLPDGRAVVVWAESPNAYANRRRKSNLGRIVASSAVPGGGFGQPHALTKYVRSGMYDVLGGPIGQVIGGPKSQPYLVGDFQRDRRDRVAAILSNMTLGTSVRVTGDGASDTFVGFTESGVGLAVWSVWVIGFPIYANRFPAPPGDATP